jgi:hypothetical protein
MAASIISKPVEILDFITFSFVKKGSKDSGEPSEDVPNSQ